jgi:hypothetical protein
MVRDIVKKVTRKKDYVVAQTQNLTHIQLGEAKRRYEAHFISKLSDCDGENSETDTWLDYARDCGYLSSDKHEALTSATVEVGKMLGAMLNNPQPFLLKPKTDRSSDF